MTYKHFVIQARSNNLKVRMYKLFTQTADRTNKRESERDSSVLHEWASATSMHSVGLLAHVLCLSITVLIKTAALEVTVKNPSVTIVA